MTGRRDDDDNPLEEFSRILEELMGSRMDDFQNDDRSPFGDSPGFGLDVDELPFDLDGGFDGDLQSQFGTQEVAADLVEYDDEYVVALDLPGFEKGDIDLTLADENLHVSASRDFTEEEDDGTFIRRERWSESVSRVISVPETVDDEGVEASFENGVLTVTLPKIGGDGHEIEIE